MTKRKTSTNWSEVKYPHIDEQGLILLEQCKKRDAKKKAVKIDEKTTKLVAELK